MSVETAHQLEMLEPCGIGNPAPVVHDAWISRSGLPRAVGKEGQHLKLSLFDGRDGARGDCVRPRRAGRNDLPTCVDVVYALETNDWYGDERPQLRIEDIRAAE